MFDIHVPAQALASAINELSRQTGTQMFAAGDLVAGLSSRAVNGRLTSEQALRELLAGTSLEATRTNNGGFAIRRPAV
ncbi:STN domain-containing protein, partial [Escherichia coli]|uniref:STN domain-containing protein n=1 Tax=Escherichia coli TaxID=562 RepID=UPI0022F03AB6